MWTRRITDRAEKLLDISQVVVADAYFSKNNFVNPLTQVGFTVVYRFQIGFLYRDGKQYAALVNCQARSKEKLHFNLNASLSAINIAKVVHWYSIQKQEKGAFSMAEIKTMNHNTLLLNRFIDVFAINPNKLENTQKLRACLNFFRMNFEAVFEQIFRFEIEDLAG